MLHETADSGQCSIAHMIGAGQESGYRLIKELIFHAFVHIAFFHQQAGNGEKAADLRIFFLSRNPMERLGRSIRKMLEKIHTSKLRNLNIPDVLHPYIRNFGQETVNRLEQSRQYFTFANIFFPKCLRQSVVFLVSGSNALDTGQLHAKVEFVDQTFLAHTLGHSPVHGEAELCLYFFELFC